jgi:ElaB/YqjD/DUF883 family membrane-anchored ribosome-binding protein
MASSTQEIKALKQEVKDLKKTLASVIEEKATTMQSRFSKDNMSKLAADAGETARGFLTTRKRQLKRVKGNTKVMIKRHPFVSTAIALGGVALLTTGLRYKK